MKLPRRAPDLRIALDTETATAPALGTDRLFVRSKAPGELLRAFEVRDGTHTATARITGETPLDASGHEDAFLLFDGVRRRAWFYGAA